MIDLAKAEVQKARSERRFDEHLREGSRKNPQPTGKCPSNNPFGIERPCVDSDPANRLKANAGPNLVMAPALLVSNWVREASNHLDMEDKQR